MTADESQSSGQKILFVDDNPQVQTLVVEMLETLGYQVESALDPMTALKLISEGAIYKNPDDPVPVSGTVATLFRIDANDVVRASDCDLLGRNFWGLANVMSR